MSYRVAVCVSGGGSNLQALLDRLQGEEPARVVLVLSNRAEAGGLERARRAGVPAELLADPADASEWITRLGRRDVDLVVLAGYLKLVPPGVVQSTPAASSTCTLPCCPPSAARGCTGDGCTRRSFASGAAESGPTVHLVDEVYDRGADPGAVPGPGPAGRHAGGARGARARGGASPPAGRRAGGGAGGPSGPDIERRLIQQSDSTREYHAAGIDFCQ